MARRLELHKILQDILGNDERVYYQPPESIKLRYPCIVYERYNKNPMFADNIKYTSVFSYSITYIDPNPDSDEILAKLDALPFSRFDRHFTIDNLNHDVFIIFY